MTAPALVSRSPRSRRGWTSRQNDWAIGGVLAVIAFLGLFPFLFILVGSFKTQAQFTQSYWLPAFPLHFENYGGAWEQIRGYTFNSFIVGAVTALSILVLGTTAGFVFARFRFPGRNFFFASIIALLAVPGIINLVPLFLLMRSFHLIDTLWALIIPYTVGNLYTTVYLMRNAVQGIGEEIFEAALLDGASGPQIYTRIALPLILPTMGTVVITTLTGVWNEYLWALLVINDPEKRTIGTGLQFFTNQLTTDYGPLFAGYLLASLPLLILFSFASRYFVAGLQAGGTKL